MPRRALATIATLILAGAAAQEAATQDNGQQQPPADVELALPSALWTPEATSPLGMVVASSQAASWAGREMIESGGNAVDAAVAAALAAGVSEPGSAGIGGQTLMLLALANGHTLAIDGAGIAPRAVDRESLWTKRRTYAGYGGYDTVAVPGTVAALALALERYGTKTLAEVLAPAIELAELGTVMPLYEHALVTHYARRVRGSLELCSTLLENCWDIPAPGKRFCLPDLACTLRRVAALGAREFYRGAIASQIDAEMVAHGGSVRRGDLAGFRAKERSPARGSYRGFEVVSFPFPGGGVAVVEALQILESYPMESLAAMNQDRIHLIAEAVRLALADALPAPGRSRGSDLLACSKELAARRASRIRLDRALFEDEIGRDTLLAWESRDTTQITTADADGNVVSLTTTLGRTFGSGVASPGLGFTYNSLLLNYNLEDATNPAFLRPGAAPFSTMAPTIVLKDGKPFLALGSAGSEVITAVIVGVISNVIDAGLPLCEAVTAPRISAQAGVSSLELEVFAPVTAHDASELESRGFDPVLRRWFPTDAEGLCRMGSANAILIDPAGATLIGVGDPRRQGVALGARRLVGQRPSPLAELPCWIHDEQPRAGDRRLGTKTRGHGESAPGGGEAGP